MDSWAQDIRFALRQLRKTPLFTVTAIVTLGLGIGVNAAMFSVIEQVVLRALPYGHQDRLVAMQSLHQGGASSTSESFSLPDLKDYAARAHSIEAIAAYTFQLPTLGGTDNPQLVPQLMATPNLFEVLGFHTQLGRGFTPDDGKPGHTRVLVLGNAVWKKFYNADPAIVGRSIPINGDPYTIIGVLPPDVLFPMGTGQEIISPLNLEDASLQDRGSGVLQAVALLRPGITAAQAETELTGIHAQLLHDYPKDEMKGEVIRLVDYRAFVTQNSRAALFALDWAVFAVWLIACANVAGLMLTRSNSRRREIAIRGALGAPRVRILRQFLTESLLISVGGAAFGLGVATLTLRLLRHFLVDAVLFGADIHVNGEVLGFLLFASCLSALLFGWAPAWHAANVPAQEGLREGTAAAGTSRRQALWRDAMAVTEISLTLALLIAAGLMMRTLLSLRHTDLGFATGNILTGALYLPTHGAWWTLTASPKAGASIIQTFYDPLAQKLRQTPGVVTAGFTTVRPLEPQWNFDDDVVVRDRPTPPPGQEVHAQVRAATTGYFQAMGIRLLSGRLFGEEDGPATPIAVLVNQTFVHSEFPHENPLGQQIEVGDKGKPRRWGTIVGVTEDARQNSPGQVAVPEIDVNLEQLIPTDEFYPILATFHMDLAVRTHLDPKQLEKAVRRDVHDLQPQIAVESLEPMQQVVDDSLGGQTLAARLLGIFGLAALLIAVAGIYGLLAYSVSQRTRELGVRLALGAQRGDIIWLILRHALWLLGAGTAIGLVVAWIARNLMRSYLYGAAGYDMATIALVVLALGSCGVVASYWPARRAASVDPVEALRTE
ncbi:MAG TPA: ABC transporter permease [Acidobacteriaceae bacterium]|jgi:predicted permease|nr:ABC transporter permease [Acidobacteriaceae bacterium]